MGTFWAVHYHARKLYHIICSFQAQAAAFLYGLYSKAECAL